MTDQLSRALGDTPWFHRGQQVDPKRLFYSDPNRALQAPITLVPGYGPIPMGTVIAQIAEGTREGYFVPYSPLQPTAGDAMNNIGSAILAADATASTAIYVSIQDSYKFVVGDTLYISDDTNYSDEGVGHKDLGAITDIDREYSAYLAEITVTTAATADYTVANGARVQVITDSTAMTSAKGILKEGQDTGIGEDAKGANGVVVVSNAMVYTGMVWNMDATALTDIPAARLGQYTVFK